VAASAPAVATARPIEAAAAGGPVTSATVSFSGGGRRIPPGFLGLSVEYDELQSYEQAGPLFTRVLALIRPRDGGPLTLRIGGKSADHTLWVPTATQSSYSIPIPHQQPLRLFQANQKWLTGLASFIRGEDLRVILDLNLAVHSTAMAVGLAQAAVRTLPAGSVAGFEIGNEPDMYHYQPRLQTERVASTSRATPATWWDNYSAADYRRDYTAYARALLAGVPGVALGAPDIVDPKPDWIAAMTRLGSLGPRFLAIHGYGSSACWPPGSPNYPSTPALLAESASAGLAGALTRAVAAAHAQRIAIRITEMNSVSCGGNPGVADAFATALWAPDALFALIEAGVDGVSWHIRPGTVNAPFRLIPGGIVPLPELYGLAVFAQMTHGPASVLDTSLVAASGLRLKAWAVRKGNTVNVLLINKGPRAATVALPPWGGATDAVVRRLTAPGVTTSAGVRFAGMSIGADGRWHGRPVQSAVPATAGHYDVPVPGYSAALVTL
jgi:hypothetical protein